MDLKQSNCLNKITIKSFIDIIDNLEEKLSSIKVVHNQLNDLILIISNTHENIYQELNFFKNILNENIVSPNTNQQEKFPSDETTSECSDDDQQQDIHYQTNKNNSTEQFESKSLTNINPINEKINSSINRQSSCSSSTNNSLSTNSLLSENRPNSSQSKRSSNLKKSSQTSSRIKSPKSVSFNFDENNQKANAQDENSLKQINNKINENSSTSIRNSNEIKKQNHDLIQDLFKQHHHDINHKTNIGFHLGSSLTQIVINDIESENGNYIQLLNKSNSDRYDLSQHFLQQNLSCVPTNRFRFPSNTIIHPGQTVTVWSGSSKNVEPKPPNIFIFKEQKKWETGPECVTILSKPNGQSIAWARSNQKINANSNQSSYSKSNENLFDQDMDLSNSSKNFSRPTSSNLNSTNKSRLRKSSSNWLNNDQNQIYSKSNCSQLHQTSGLSHLLNRPKSSPFSSHQLSKQNFISMNYL